MKVPNENGEIKAEMAHGKKRPRDGLFGQVAPVLAAVAVAAVIIFTATR